MKGTAIRLKANSGTAKNRKGRPSIPGAGAIRPGAEHRVNPHAHEGRDAAERRNGGIRGASFLQRQVVQAGDLLHQHDGEVISHQPEEEHPQAPLGVGQGADGKQLGEAGPRGSRICREGISDPGHACVLLEPRPGASFHPAMATGNPPPAAATFSLWWRVQLKYTLMNTSPARMEKVPPQR